MSKLAGSHFDRAPLTQRLGAPTQSKDTKTCQLALYANALPTALSNDLFNLWQRQVPWEQPTLQLYGRPHPIPRKQYFAGDPGVAYEYSKKWFQANSWPVGFNQVAKFLSTLPLPKYNAGLFNYYLHGQHYMSWHRDNEPTLGEMPVIISISLGATRRMGFRKYGESKMQFAWPLTHGSLLVMSGNTQTYYEHSLLKTAKPVGPRVNLTLRQIISS